MHLMLLVLVSLAVGCLSKKPAVCYLPLCREGCKIVSVPGQECPSCVCDDDSGATTKNPVVCSIPLCRVGCKIVSVPGQECPTCVCDDDSGATTKCPGTNEVVKDCAKPKWCNACGIRGDCKLADCTKGCDCKDGFYRDDSGVCIPQDQCPGNGLGDEQCKEEGEEHTDCGSGCAPKCGNLNKEFGCAAVCIPGCFCKRGLVRNAEGKCIKAEQCPPGTCGENTVTTSCENPCNDCDKKGNCNFYECYPGCNCNPGYHRESLSRGRCIPESQCPL